MRNTAAGSVGVTTLTICLMVKVATCPLLTSAIVAVLNGVMKIASHEPPRTTVNSGYQMGLSGSSLKTSQQIGI